MFGAARLGGVVRREPGSGALDDAAGLSVGDERLGDGDVEIEFRQWQPPSGRWGWSRAIRAAMHAGGVNEDVQAC